MWRCRTLVLSRWRWPGGCGGSTSYRRGGQRGFPRRWDRGIVRGTPFGGDVGGAVYVFPQTSGCGSSHVHQAEILVRDLLGTNDVGSNGKNDFVLLPVLFFLGEEIFQYRNLIQVG